MENARDSFYIYARNQLAVVNPQRTLMLRGVQRPGILVEENESAVAVPPPDVFVLRWTSAAFDDQHALPLASQQCEIHYWTEGSLAKGGLDRGKLLAEMDVELTQMLRAKNAAKLNYTGSSGNAPLAMATRIFWNGVSLMPVETAENCVSRVAKVTVFSYEEAADL